VRRLELVEIHEQQWFPQQLREGVTDILQGDLNLAGYVELVAPLLRSALKRTNARRVVDLCAGSGGPWMRLHRLLESDVSSVCLTDKFPNTVSSERLDRATKLQIDYARESVDAQSVPHWLKGFRTMFNSFHHFEPDRASDILRNAVERQEGVAIFEVPQRSAPTICATCLMALATFVVVPFVRPFRFSLLLWTYVIPVPPFIMWLDGLISCLRAYTPAELMELAAASSTEPYLWRNDNTGLFASHCYLPDWSSSAMCNICSRLQ
jgi:hypothetical protein